MSDQPTISVAARRGPLRVVAGLVQWFDRTPRLLLFGLVVSVLGTFELSRVHAAPWTLQGFRTSSLRGALDMLKQGGPVLTTTLPDSGALVAVGGSDDQGLYLFVPLLARALGWEDPVNLLRWTALVALAVPVTLYPWLIRELTGSTLGALLAPFALLIGLWRLPLHDIYWVSTWVVLALLPVVLLLDRRWGRFSLPLLLGLLVLASLASSIRGLAGLPILICAALVVARRPWSGLVRTGAVALCVLAYLSVNTFALEAARAERERQLDGRELQGVVGNSHPFWHTAYIGLGYLPNDWDIRYLDEIAVRDVKRVDPQAEFLGEEYGRILRGRYFDIVSSEPVYAVKVHVAKLLVALKPGIAALLVLAVLAPFLLLVDPRRARWRRDGLFILIAVVIGLGSPLVATPFSSYLFGWLGAVLFAAIFAIAATLGSWPAAAACVRSLRARPSRALIGSVAAGLLVVVAIAVAAPPVERTALDWNNRPPPVLTP